MASMLYDMDLERVSSGYVVASGLDADATSAAMNDADAAVEEFTTVLAKKLKDDIPPLPNLMPLKIRRGGKVTCRRSGPRSPCK